MNHSFIPTTSQRVYVTQEQLSLADCLLYVEQFNKEDGAVSFADSCFADPTLHRLELWREEKCIGMLSYKVEDFSENADETILFLHVEAVFIFKDYQGQGLSYHLCEGVAEQFLKQHKESLINNSDTATLIVHGDTYGEAGERFISGLFESLAFELEPFGVNVEESIEF